jgi:hypothetical protein
MINFEQKGLLDSLAYASFTDEERTIFKTWLGGLLRDGVVDLTFVKKDGTIRNMKATLKEDLVAAVSGTGKIRNDESIAVTDTEINQWRSIRFDSIKEIKFSLE